MSFGDYVYVVNSTNSQAMEELGFDIQPGDRVVEVNGKRIDFAMEVSMASLQAGEENGTYSMGLERTASSGISPLTASARRRWRMRKVLRANRRANRF